MLKQLIFGAIAFFTTAEAAGAAAPPPPPATDADHDAACQIYGDDDFTHFNLTSIDKPGKESYFKDGL